MTKKDEEKILPKIVVSDEFKEQHSPAAGAGRPPKALQLKNYEVVLKRLDGCIEEVMDTLEDLLHNDDPYVRLRVAEMLLKKYLPDKKIKENVNTEPSININIDKRNLVIDTVKALDSMDYEELRESAINGNFGLSKTKS